MSPVQSLGASLALLTLTLAGTAALCTLWPALGASLVESGADLLLYLGAQLSAAGLVGLIVWSVR